MGKKAVEFALSQKSGIMPVIQRVSEQPYEWSIDEGDLKDIANEEKVLPNDYISDCGFRITQKGVNYLSPLIKEKITKV